MMEKTLTTLLTKEKLTLSSAESCTGGLFAHRITNIPGSSKFFLGGVIAYSPESKNKILKVSKELLNEYGMVSKECARAMAENCRKIFSSHIGVGITGVAGPEKLENKSVGVVYIAIAADNKTYVKKYKFKGKRTAIKSQAVEEACRLIIKLLK